MISIIIPVLNGSKYLRKCLDGVFSSTFSDFECILVDDGSTDGSQDIACEYDINQKQLIGGPYGPAYARNQGAEIARGEILFFIDADVVIKPDTLTKIMSAFEKYPSHVAVFGSYDEAPDEAGFISQYKNLFHHFVHQQGNEEGGTFWSGCGAIRRDIFGEMGGFDHKRFPKPSIEDIDLGLRLREKGYKIRLDKNIQAKHLKRWSLTGLVRTDVVDRAIPWTFLIMDTKELPNDLNLKLAQRVSAGLSVLFLGLMGLVAFLDRSAQVPVIGALFFLLIGHWNTFGSDNFIQMDRKTEVVLYLLLGLGGVASLRAGNDILSLLFACLLLISFFSLYFSRQFIGAKKFVFAILTSLLFLTYFLSIENSPLTLKLLSYLVLALIIVLNSALYRFMMVKRGLFFSLAVMPFHLLYYSYSIAAFLIAGGIHLVRANRTY